MPQTLVLSSLDGLRTDNLVIPNKSFSDVLVASVDDITLGNVDPFMDKEVIRGEFLTSVEEWNGITRMHAGKLIQIFERLDQLI